MSKPYFNELPCGHCDAGLYAYDAVSNGFEMFGDCKTRREALRKAPMCKCESDHICFGCRDWIVAADFPISEQDQRKALGE